VLTDSDDSRWLTVEWRRTRELMRARIVALGGEIFADIADHGTVTDAAWTGFIERVAKQLMQRPCPASDCALSLLGDSRPLRQALEASGARLMGEDAPAIRVVAVRRGLTRMRNAAIGGSEHRAKTWGRLDQISRSVAGPDATNRCTIAHFRLLAEHLREHHASDRNLPRTIITIEEYFAEFCADCGPSALDSDAEVERPFLPMEADLPELARSGRFLEECLSQLEDEPGSFVRVHFKMTDPVEFSTSGYCQRQNIDRRRFYRVLEDALSALSTCLTTKAEGLFEHLTGFQSGSEQWSRNPGN